MTTQTISRSEADYRFLAVVVLLGAVVVGLEAGALVSIFVDRALALLVPLAVGSFLLACYEWRTKRRKLVMMIAVIVFANVIMDLLTYAGFTTAF